jgi:hypothetical protein
MGKPGERYHVRLVSLIQYILCFVFLILCSKPRDYLKHIMKSTNMSCLKPVGTMSGNCDFLSANMYARSLFGSFSVPSSVLIRFLSLTDEDALLKTPKQVTSQAMSAFAAKRKASPFHWVIVSPWVRFAYL